MQTDAVEPSQRAYRYVYDPRRVTASYSPFLASSYLHCISKVYAKEGIAGFFKGFTPAIIRAFPANAACFLGYEYTKELLMKK